MKNLKKEEWDLEKETLLKEIINTQDKQFGFSDFKIKIKRKIPLNCYNYEETIASLNDLNPGYIFGGEIIKRERIDKWRKDFIEIINSVEFKDKIEKPKNIMKKILDSLHLKPNFFGLGLNLNEILEIIFNKK
jgi:hypothetical protein